MLIKVTRPFDVRPNGVSFSEFWLFVQFTTNVYSRRLLSALYFAKQKRTCKTGK